MESALLALLDSIGEDGYGETFGADARAAYDADMNTAMAAVTTAQGERDTALAELTKLKAVLFDMQIAASASADSADDDADDNDGDDNDDDDENSSPFMA